MDWTLGRLWGRTTVGDHCRSGRAQSCSLGGWLSPGEVIQTVFRDTSANIAQLLLEVRAHEEDVNFLSAKVLQCTGVKCSLALSQSSGRASQFMAFHSQCHPTASMIQQIGRLDPHPAAWSILASTLLLLQRGETHSWYRGRGDQVCFTSLAPDPSFFKSNNTSS